jgi:hypothetical protein
LVCTVRAFFGGLLTAAANATPHASNTAKLMEANSRTILLIPNSFFSGEEEKMKTPTPLRN